MFAVLFILRTFIKCKVTEYQYCFPLTKRILLAFESILVNPSIALTDLLLYTTRRTEMKRYTLYLCALRKGLSTVFLTYGGFRGDKSQFHKPCFYKSNMISLLSMITLFISFTQLNKSNICRNTVVVGGGSGMRSQVEPGRVLQGFL